ncbi:MAG: LTA synthase family protein [Clostridia bacterium]|nr:LTA synthase family protein [Clostridia bacterium]
MKKKQKRKSIAGYLILSILLGILWTLASILTALAVWYQNTFSMEFGELLYTLLSPLGGTGVSTVSQILEACLLPVILSVSAYVAAVILLYPREERLLCRKMGRVEYARSHARTYRILRRICALLCVVAFLFSAGFACIVFRIPQYIAKSMGYTTIYSDHYVDPNRVSITDIDGKPRNLIYVYVESLESTYYLQSNGGAQKEHDLMPGLTALAKEHISFSDSAALGGFHSIAGTSWTMGALMGTTSGVPFSLSIFGEKAHNSLGKDGNFVNGLTALGDILEEKGYTQEFLCGSDIGFAGRDAYFTQHGNYKLFDYYTAIEKGYIDEDYKVWWGYEDSILFDIARDEVTNLAKGDKPFNFTMLTVDTHHVGGYRCTECGDEFPTKLENVIACTDRLVSEFVAWCMEQDFYENTTIIVTGDHPRMDTQLVKGIDTYNRTIYNCFINSLATPVSEEATHRRIWTSLDMFPSILAAMGYSIEGERLGLGTNIFSDVPTLAEKYGFDWLENEVSKYSEYYKIKFS